MRKPLSYRLEELDSLIRRQRTVREAEAIRRAKAVGVKAPYVYLLDVSGATLVMEYIAGRRLKDLLSEMSSADARELFRELGENVAGLHSGGIMHGDLTTANVLLRGSELVLLDFGLSIHSSKVEDHAVDLRLIKETLGGAHPSVAKEAFESFRAGYAKEAGSARSKAVFSQLANIERRGRYARVV